MNPPLAVSLFLMFLLVSSVTFTNFAYAQIKDKQSNIIKLKVESKGGFVQDYGDFSCDVSVKFHWKIVDEKGNIPNKKDVGIRYGIWVDGKPHYGSESYIMPGEPIKNQKKIEYLTGKEHTITIKIIGIWPDSLKYTYSGDGDPITLKYTCPKRPLSEQEQEKTESKYEIDSVIDDLSEIVDPFTGQRRMKQTDASPKSADPKQIISDIEELTRKTEESLSKQMQEREKTKKIQKDKTIKPNDSNKKETHETLTDFYTITKWIEYANQMASDALKQQIKEAKNKIKNEKPSSTDKSVTKSTNDHLLREYEESLKHSEKLAKEIKELDSEIKKEAKNSKISQADLNKAAKEPLDKLKSKKEITPNNKIKEAQKAFDKLGNMLDELGPREGDDLGKLEKSIPIPEDMKDLAGLGDSAIELKVVAKNGAYRGDRCTGVISFSWTLADEKKNPPKTPLYMLLEIWSDNKKTPNTIMLNNFGSKYVYVSEDFSDKEFKKTLNSKIKTTDKINGTFNWEMPTDGDISEDSFTLKIAKIGPEDSGYFYSGTGDAITVKIPACPKAQFKVIEKNGTFRGDPCDKEITMPIYWKLVDGEKNPAKTPLYALLEVSTNGEKWGGRAVINNIDDEVVFMGYKDNPDERFKKNYDSSIKKGIKTKDSFNYSTETDSSSSEQVFTYKIVKIGPLSSGYTYSGNGDTITVKIPACQKKEPKNIPDLVVKSTSIQHDGTYFIFTWYFEQMKDHPLLGDLSNSAEKLDFAVRITEGNSRPRLFQTSGNLDKVSVMVLDTGKDIKVADLEILDGGSTANGMFDDVKGAKPLSIKGKSLPPLKITPPKITSDDQWKYVAEVYYIGEHYYPREQFIRNPPSTCTYDYYGTKTGYAISLDLHVMEDPSPSGCGFGMASMISPGAEYATKAQILKWEKVTGISIKADDYD